MGGELIQIIYRFLISVFTTSASNNVINFNLLTDSVWKAFRLSIYNKTSFFSEFNNISNLYSGQDGLYCLVAWLLTWVIVIFLIILLFKLFKRMFNLIFKLFRLN